MERTFNKRRFWILYHTGLAIFSFIAGSFMKYRQTGTFISTDSIVPVTTIFLMSALIGYLAMYLVRKGAKLSHEQLRKRILPMFIFFLAATVVIANVVVSLGVFIAYLVKGHDLKAFFPNLFKYELSFANSSYWIWLLFFSIAFFYILWRKSSEKEQLLREQLLKFQYDRLKSQVNPHFLFNSLNTLSELVYHDAKKADSYIQKLSNIYRYILENEESELIPLGKEIAFVNDFFNLQKERDGDKIALNIDIRNMDQYLVVPVSLQMLVENALKHNACSKSSPLEITIKRELDYIVVSNKVQKKNVMEQSTQLGLQNLEKRVQMILKSELIVKEDNLFTVKVPYREVLR